MNLIVKFTQLCKADLQQIHLKTIHLSKVNIAADMLLFFRNQLNILYMINVCLLDVYLIHLVSIEKLYSFFPNFLFNRKIETAQKYIPFFISMTPYA